MFLVVSTKLYCSGQEVEKNGLAGVSEDELRASADGRSERGATTPSLKLSSDELVSNEVDSK